MNGHGVLCFPAVVAQNPHLRVLKGISTTQHVTLYNLQQKMLIATCPADRLGEFQL